MTELLLIIGIVVFFVSVYGAVMVGGHLLEELERTDQRQAARPQRREDDHELGVAVPPSRT